MNLILQRVDDNELIRRIDAAKDDRMSVSGGASVHR